MEPTPDTLNPYAAPESNQLPERNPNLPQIGVDGDFLVVADGVSLPPRCIFTNEPISGPLILQSLKWAPSFRPVLAERRFQLRFAVSRPWQKKTRRNRYIASICQVLAAVMLYLVTANGFVTGVILAFALFALWEKPKYLRVIKCEDDRLWLNGCGPEFFASCIDEFGSIYQTQTSVYPPT